MLPVDLRRLLHAATVAAMPKAAAIAPEGSHLAGGKARAVSLLHRISRDLDVLIERDFDPGDVTSRLKRVGTFSITSMEWGALNGVLDGVRVQFLRARQRPLDPMPVVAALRVAGVRDLMADKLKVIGARGELRDYFDLLAIERAGQHRVEDGLAYYRERYDVGPDDVRIGHIVRGLGYFDDVVDDPGLPLPRAEIEAYWHARQLDIIRSIAVSSLVVSAADQQQSGSCTGACPPATGLCGAATTRGGSCRNPAGRCPHHGREGR